MAGVRAGILAIEYTPLLQVQRDLYRLPRGPDRFRAYIRTMVDPGTGDLGLPLVAMNPMGKDHVPAFLDTLLAEDADAEAARATDEAGLALGAELGGCRACLVVSDDLHGGWTNRYTSEHDHRFRQGSLYTRGWIVAILWTSETYSPEAVREEMLQCIFRAAYVLRHAAALTLAQMMAQEGYAMSRAGARGPALDAEDLAYTREVLAPYRSSTDYPTILAALYGDEAATQLGHRPLGLSPRAGLALALHEAD